METNTGPVGEAELFALYATVTAELEGLHKLKADIRSDLGQHLAKETTLATQRVYALLEQEAKKALVQRDAEIQQLRQAADMASRAANAMQLTKPVYLILAFMAGLICGTGFLFSVWYHSQSVVNEKLIKVIGNQGAIYEAITKGGKAQKTGQK